jgi:glyoxylase-like metal-dependent hydrolase (beta-lactamase superfamily II)
MLRIGLAAILVSTFPLASIAADLLPEPTRVSEHAWAWIGPYGPPTAENRGFRMNLGFVVGEQSVAVIDAGYSAAMAEAMIAQIAKVTDRPISHLIITNSQPHRIMGAPAFRRAGAAIVAASEAVPRITGQGEALAASVAGVLGVPADAIEPPGAPDQAIEAELRIELGDVALRVVPVGHAHTEGSLIAVVEPDGTLFAGDVLYAGRLLAVLPESDLTGWIDAYDGLRAYGEALFVPGHGEPGPLGDFETPTYAYLTALKVHMDEALDEGADLQDAIDSFDQSAWESLADFEMLSGRNAHQAYIQSEAAAFD